MNFIDKTEIWTWPGVAGLHKKNVMHCNYSTKNERKKQIHIVTHKKPHKMHHQITIGNNFHIGTYFAYFKCILDNNNFTKVHGHFGATSNGFEHCSVAHEPMIETFNWIRMYVVIQWVMHKPILRCFVFFWVCVCVCKSIIAQQCNNKWEKVFL